MSLKLNYDEFIQGDVMFTVNNAEFYENPYTIFPKPTDEASFLEIDEFTHYEMTGKRDEFEEDGIIDNLWSDASITKNPYY